MKIVRYHIINAFFSDTSIANSLMSYTSTTQVTEHNGPQHKKISKTHEPDISARGLGTRFLFCLRGFLFVCVVSVLFARFLFCVRGFCFVCVVPFLFAFSFFICVVSFFYLRGFLFVCVFSFLFAWFPFLFACFLFCLQRVPCGPS